MPRYWDRVSHDPYTDPQTGILRNKLGIKDEATLDRAESVLAAAGAQIWRHSPESSRYDLDHLQRIHRQLFSHTYEWAGQIRTVNIRKGGARFTEARQIESAAHVSFSKLATERSGLVPGASDQFAKHAARTLSEVNRIHPFREGNGRTQREFVGQLARENAYSIRWEGVTKERMAEASYDGMQGRNEPLERLIRERLTGRHQESSMAKSLETALDSDRIRLERMTRSYGPDDPKQATIEHARTMLQRIEQSARDKRPTVELTASSDRSSEVHADSLKLIQKSITSADRSGLHVRHELREQWQSALHANEHRLQAGKDHDR